jgi:four helix bundle protein
MCSMSSRGLENFGEYKKARELFAFVIGDFSPLANDVQWSRLVSQQVASADSICANIEEGYGRGTKKEFTQFLVIARGSAWETRGRYERMATCLSRELIEARTALCTEVIAILTATILSLRKTR